MLIAVKDLNSTVQLTVCFFDRVTGEPLNADGGGDVKVYPWGSDVPCSTGSLSIKDSETGFYKYACNISGQSQGGYTALFKFTHGGTESKGILKILILDTLSPVINDIHFTSAVTPQDFEIYLTDTNITEYQTEPYERNEELNVIDTFDFAFDKVSAKAPLQFFKFLSQKAVNSLKVKKNGNTIYIGKVSGVKSETAINFANKTIEIESHPLMEDISTFVSAYDIAAASPINIIKQLLDANVNSQYSVAKMYGMASALGSITVSVDTDGQTDNVKSIIQSLCEAFNIGIYMDALTVKAFIASVFPDDATDILDYMVGSRPTFKSRGDLFADYIILKYKTGVGASEAQVTSGTGNVVKEITISDPIFTDATSAQLAADRALAIYSQDIYEAEIDVDKTALFNLGDYIKYSTELGDFICLIIGKQTTRNQITYRVLGVLK